jgi:hypothetical protein
LEKNPVFFEENPVSIQLPVVYKLQPQRTAVEVCCPE